MSSPSCRAWESISSICGTARRQLRRPMAFRWLISTGVRRLRATVSISERASTTPSPSCRMWTVMGNAGIPQGFQRPDEAGSIIEALRRISQPQGDTQRTVPQCPLQQGVELTVFRLRQRVRPGTRPHRPGGVPIPTSIPVWRGGRAWAAWRR